MEKAPPPATKMTVGLPSPEQFRCSLRPPMSINWPGGGYFGGTCSCGVCEETARPMIRTGTAKRNRTSLNSLLGLYEGSSKEFRTKIPVIPFQLRLQERQ